MKKKWQNQFSGINSYDWYAHKDTKTAWLIYENYTFIFNHDK